MSHDNGNGTHTPLPESLAGQVLETRTILMFGEVNAALVESVTRQLLLLASRSGHDITLVVNAQGGAVEAGETLADLIRGVGPTIRVLGAGSVANAALLAFVAPPRAQRFCLPHARFSLHQRFAGGPPEADPLALAQAVAQQRRRVLDLLAHQTGQPLDVLERDLARPSWLDAEAALAYGLISRIITSSTL